MTRGTGQDAAKHINFRLKASSYEVVAAVAEARGMDVSSALNSIVADAVPSLLAWQTRQEAGIRAARDGQRQLLVDVILGITGMTCSVSEPATLRVLIDNLESTLARLKERLEETAEGERELPRAG